MFRLGDTVDYHEGEQPLVGGLRAVMVHSLGATLALSVIAVLSAIRRGARRRGISAF